MSDPSAVADLLEAAAACATAPLSPGWRELVDPSVAAREAARFKVDLSFSLLGVGESGARLSVNDKGEEVAFRERLREVAPSLGLAEAQLDAMLGVSPPGVVQTTLGVKWPDAGGAPSRVTLYHEELFRAADGAALIAEVFHRFGARPPEPRSGVEPGAVAVDIHREQVVGLKDYWIATEKSAAPTVALPKALEAFRRATPFARERGTRRYLVARRFDRAGDLVGHKLLWMSEAHEPAAVARAWAFVDDARRRLALPASRASRALDRLRSRWSHPASLYPDLVSLDLDRDEQPLGLTVYVSLKG